ncbi:hypothetical protein ABLE94_07380 [Gordonia sp. VNK1]|jgi:hypothetical protein|uniref:hypothetical protein n=1 Tax=Gordonia oleivorans TaxID=3156618 RepID=UPI0032B37B9A
MIDGDDAFVRALNGDPTLVDGLGPRVRAVFAELSADYLRPLTIAVAGRAGTGRDTMARALRERLAISALGPGEDPVALADADLTVYVLVAGVRDSDRAALEALMPDRGIVVLGKADTHDDPDAAAERAERIAAELGRPVIAVSQLLACADLTADEVAFLRSSALGGEQMPSMSAKYLRGAPGSAERVMRRTLLQRLDRYGIETVLDLLVEDIPGDAGALNAVLHRLSGIDALVPAFGALVDGVRRRRAHHARAEVDDLAAAGADRDVLERLLRVPQVTL